MNNILMTLVMAAAVLNFSGCIFLAAGAAGATTAKWLSDKVTDEVDRPRADVVQAARNALEAQNMNVYKETASTSVTQILAKDTAGRQVWVDVHAIGNNSSRIDVRVGWLNGEEDARRVLKAIVDKAKGWF